MRTHIPLLLLAPLAFTACKKKTEVEAAPEVAEAAEAAPPPMLVEPLTWSWSLTYAGGMGATDVGKLTYDLGVKINGENPGLLVKSWDLGVSTDAGRVCIARGDTAKKTMGDMLSVPMVTDCSYAKLPKDDEVKVVGNIMYEFGGKPMTAEIREMVAIGK